ncbi:MAG: hypothetical protein CMO81_03380 [Waddliaceae bacterium]|nr:hypothetical protein [Waddliaceae bacterium]
MSKNRSSVFFLFLLPLFLIAWNNVCASDPSHGSSAVSALIESSEAYHDDHIASSWDRLLNRINVQPFNLVSLGIFVLAILHTFSANRFTLIAHRMKEKHRIEKGFPDDHPHSSWVSCRSEIMHFLGEVEIIFLIWSVPLFWMMTFYYDYETAAEYINTRNYTEPLFVVIIMTIASTRPVIEFAEKAMEKIAGLGKHTPAAWWLSILIVGPLLGSFITEPGAMTISALLLGKHIYRLRPSKRLSYATLGLLFVNISVGGVLTHFAAPPVLMVAHAWHWTTPFMMANFGWKAALGIFVSTGLYYLIFKKELGELKTAQDARSANKHQREEQRSVPLWITIIHLVALAWVVFNGHSPAIFIGSFLLFLGFYQATVQHQTFLSLKTPLLVGCFLAGLIIHGGLQSWWISSILGGLTEGVLMISSIALTAFNDNAAITYLTTLIPNFSPAMKYTVVAGAVTGGGLTVIANAPNPAGQSILRSYFKEGIEPPLLFAAAFIPTIIMGIAFSVL